MVISTKKDYEFVVYKIIHNDSDKTYIGITTNYQRRLREHFVGHDGSCPYLHYAINKYGQENFQHEIICYCNSWEELCQKEIEYIKQFETKVPNGYNLTDGGGGSLGFSPTKETRAKMSKIHKGKIVSKETRAKMSKKLMGRIASIETRKKISESHKGKKMAPFSEEHKRKLSESKMGCKNPNYKDGSTKLYTKIGTKARTKRKILSVDQIIGIRKMLADGICQRIIAKRVGVGKTTISNIKNGKRYSEIQ